MLYAQQIRIDFNGNIEVWIDLVICYGVGEVAWFRFTGKHEGLERWGFNPVGQFVMSL